MGWFKMSDKTLAEQVATLEAERNHLELQVQRWEELAITSEQEDHELEELKASHLELRGLFDKVTLTCDQRGEEIGRLETERDSLRTSHRRVIRSLEEMKAERDELKERLAHASTKPKGYAQEMVKLREKIDVPTHEVAIRETMWREMRDAAKGMSDELEKVKADRDELKEDLDASFKREVEMHEMYDEQEVDLDELRGKLEGVELKLSYREGEVQHLLDAEGSRIPRTITAEELREGQWFAYKDDESETWHTLEAGDEDFMLGFIAPGQPHTIVLLTDATLTPPEKPERRGEVISPDKMRHGDVVDAYRIGELHHEGETISESCFFLEHSDWEFRLVHRPEPELPTEPGSVVLVTEFMGEVLEVPIYAVSDAHGDWWARFGDITFPDGYELANPDEITGWKPARIVVEDGA